MKKYCNTILTTILFFMLLPTSINQHAAYSSETNHSAHAHALFFTVNSAGDHDYGHQTVLPPTFGEGEFTVELWIKLDTTFPVGPTTFGTSGQLTHWSTADNPPYSASDWWYAGNFLLDGHNNNTFQNGTFSLQFYGGGRIRWLFGDGVVAGPGGHWSVGAYPANNTPSLLDDNWHQLTLVRRWSGDSDADLELWIDGRLIDRETSSARTNMRTYWDAWSGFPPGQEGWFWGAEKQAAIGVLSQYEDFKGAMAELRFWGIAKSDSAITKGYSQPVTGDEPGLLGYYPLSEGVGDTTSDVTHHNHVIRLINMKSGYWIAGRPPLLVVRIEDND